MTDVAVDNQNSDKPFPYVDFRRLKYVPAKIKFYNADDGFGFVTVVDDNGYPLFDAFLPGEKLIRAGYKTVTPDQIIYVKHVTKQKGEAVVMVKHPPDYVSDKPNNDPVVVKPLKRMEERRHRDSIPVEDDSGQNLPVTPVEDMVAETAERPAFPESTKEEQATVNNDDQNTTVTSPTTLP